MSSRYPHGNVVYWTRHMLIALCTASILLTMAAGGFVTADSGGSTLTTSPVSVSLTAKPGTSVSTDLQLQNNGSSAVEIGVHLEEFRASGENGQAEIYQPPANDPALSWVHFSENTFRAEPGVWHKIKMTVQVPNTAAFGYYYAVVFSPASADAVTPGASTYKGANAILVLLNARTAGEKNVLEIADFSADQHAYQYLPVTFSVKIHNTGDIYAAPRGVIYISRSLTGEVLDTLDINKGSGNVLPGTNRVFQTAWANGFPVYGTKRLNGQIVSDSAGKPANELQWDLSRINKLRFGRYYARLVVVYNDGTRDIPLYATLSFWVIPWLMLLVAGILLALVILGLWTVAHFIIKRHHPWRVR